MAKVSFLKSLLCDRENGLSFLALVSNETHGRVCKDTEAG